MIAPRRRAIVAAAPSMLGQRAGFVSRLLAFGIDAGLLTLALAFGNLLWNAAVNAPPVHWFKAFLSGVAPGIMPVLHVVGALLPLIGGTVIVCAYFLFFFVFTGQTFGKRIIGLRVVSTTGHHLTFMQAVIRLSGYLLSTIPIYIGFLAMLVDDGRRTWHDRLAGTTVVYAWKARPDERFLARGIARLRRR